MATIVCQGLQSCLQESQLVEPRTLRLKLFSATPVELGFKSFLPSESIQIKELTHEEKCHNDKPATKISDDSGGWSFLQSLSNGSSSSSSQQQNPPPTTLYNKRSWSATKLSEKSLELCTENLGNETGTIFVENNIFETYKCVAERDQLPKKSRSLGSKKSRIVHNFPPPLTTISSGSESLQVKPHREDGRLILKAVKAPLTHTCFQAERSNGRLRLCFSKDLFFAPTFHSELQSAATEEDIEADIVEDDKNERDDEQEEQGDEDNGKLALGEQEDLVSLIDEMHGNNDFKVGDEAEGMDKFERPSRCKEGGEHEKKGLLNFKTFNWVAT